MCNRRLGLSYVVVNGNGIVTTITHPLFWDRTYYFRVNVRPEIVFFSLGSPEESAARFSTWSQPLTLRRMRMWRFVFAALMW